MSSNERWLIGWECEDCDDSIGGEHSMWDLAERLRKEHEEETGHTTTVRVVEEKRILPSNGDRMKIGESMLEIAAERSDRIEWICPECQRTGEELNATKRCPDCDERLREVFPDGGSQMPDLSDSFTCAECGGRLRVTEEGSTDASAWQEHECVDCGGEGEFYISEGTKRDGGRKRGVTERNYDLQP